MIKKGKKSQMEKFIKRELLLKEDLKLIRQAELTYGIHFTSVTKKWLGEERRIKKEDSKI